MTTAGGTGFIYFTGLLFMPENHAAPVCALMDFAPIVRALLVCLLTLGHTDIGIKGRTGRRGYSD